MWRKCGPRPPGTEDTSQLNKVKMKPRTRRKMIMWYFYNFEYGKVGLIFNKKIRNFFHLFKMSRNERKLRRMCYCVCSHSLCITWFNIFRQNYICIVYIRMYVCVYIYIYIYIYCGAREGWIRSVGPIMWEIKYYLGSMSGWEGWRRSVGPIMWEMRKCYLESMSRGISYMK